MATIRPEVTLLWHRWKQIIFAAAICGLGAYVILTWFGASRFAGVFLIVMGGMIGIDGWRRVRFPQGRGGVGVVEVRERRITYLTSGLGGSISIDALERCEVHRNARGRITWVFYDAEGMLEVPGDAEGTDGLFDALVALKGVNYAQAEQAAAGKGPDIFLIWAKDKTKLH